MIHVACPACGETLEILPEHRGTAGTCKHCQSWVTIPLDPPPLPVLSRIKPYHRVAAWAVGVFVFALVVYVSKPEPTLEQQEAAGAKASAEFLESRAYRGNWDTDYVPEPVVLTPEVRYMLTAEHERVIRTAVVNAGYPAPTNIHLNGRLVVANLQIPEAHFKRLKQLPDEVGAKAALAMRNALYPRHDADPEWSYLVILKGKSPGPDLEFIHGLGFFDGDQGTVHWFPEHAIHSVETFAVF